MSLEDGRGIRRWAADLSKSMSAALSAELNRRWQLWRDVRKLAAASDDAVASTCYGALLAEHSDDSRYAADLLEEIRRKIASEEDSADRIRAERQRAQIADPSLTANVFDRLQDTFEISRQARLARLRNLVAAHEPGDGSTRPSPTHPAPRRRKALPSATSKGPDLGARTTGTARSKSQDASRKKSKKKSRLSTQNAATSTRGTGYGETPSDRVARFRKFSSDLEDD